MGHGRPQSEHHEHQPGELWGMGAPQSEHHEHQPVEFWGMGAPKASIMSISRRNCGIIIMFLVHMITNIE